MVAGLCTSPNMERMGMGHVFMAGLWVKQLLFFLLSAVATLIFLPCMIPCLVQLIQHVIKGIQVIAMPTDPEMATGQKLMSLQIIAKPKKTQEQEIKSMITKVCKDNY